MVGNCRMWQCASDARGNRVLECASIAEIERYENRCIIDDNDDDDDDQWMLCRAVCHKKNTM